MLSVKVTVTRSQELGHRDHVFRHLIYEMDRLRIQDVNSLDYEDFIQRFGNVVEHCQLAAAAVWSSRPFSSVDDLQTALEKFMDNLPMNGKREMEILTPLVVPGRTVL